MTARAPAPEEVDVDPRRHLMGRLPGVFTGRQRHRLALVVATGLAQAVAAAGAALLAPRLVSVGTDRDRLLVAGVLLVAAVVVGLARWVERVVAERLAQEYVHRLRIRLVRSALTGARPSSLGVTVARTTNDLTAVRTWIVLGIVPSIVAVPILLGVLIGLAVLHPVLAGAALVPLAILVAGLVLLAPAAYTRARSLRRHRGRMAAHLADTVGAGEAIRAAGGVGREVSAVGDRSRVVVDHAVSRAVVTGGMRGLAAGVSASAIVAVALAGSLAGVDVATVASAFMLVGMLTVPLSDIGRVSEARQGFLAAEHILAPRLTDAEVHRHQEARRGSNRHARTLLHRGLCPPPGLVHVARLDLGDGPREFLARPGERIVLSSTDPARVTAVVDLLTGAPGAPEAWVNVAGHPLLEVPDKARRLLVGVAGAGTALERGTLARAVRYRVPDSGEPVGPLLRRVGLDPCLQRLPHGDRTRLTGGGAPLTPPERARLRLARALYGSPPMVVLDRLDAELGAGGPAVVRAALADVPGVVVLVSDQADAIVPGARVVDLDAPAGRMCARPAPTVGRQASLVR